MSCSVIESRSVVRKSIAIISLPVIFLMMIGALSAFQGRGDDSTWQWTSSTNGHREEIKIRGDVQFTDDEGDVKSLSPGGYLSVKEKWGATDRQYEVRYAGSGKLERIYSVRGERQEIDQDGRSWIATMMLTAIRQTGFNASGRVARILKKNGASGVLAEISLVTSDNAKRIYFEELTRQGHLDAALTQRAIQQATREISSDSTKATLLEKWSELYVANDSTVSTLIQGANSISSDSSHAEVLAEILRRPNISRAQLSEVFRSIRRISSDSSKRGVLIRIADNKLTDDSVVTEYISTLESISSDSEHRKALLAVLNKPRVSDENLLQIMRAVHTISSDGEKATVLITIVDVMPNKSNLVAEYLDASKSISSNGERGRVLLALMRKPNLSQDTSILVFRAADDLSSDSEKARVLIRAIAVCSNKDNVILALLDTVRRINSDSAKVQILASLLDKGGLSRSVLEQTLDLARNDINSSSARSNVMGMVNERLLRESPRR